MSNKVVITLAVKDEISSVLGGIRGKFSSLTSPLSDVGSQLDGLKPRVSGVGQAFSGILATVGGVAVAVAGVVQLAGGLREALDMETSSLGAANSMSVLLKTQLVDAQKLNDILNTGLNERAMKLPGNAADFIKTKDSLTPSVASAVNGNIEEFKRIISPLSERLTLAGQGAIGGKIDGSRMGEAIGKFIADGSSLKESLQMDGLQKTGLDNQIKDIVKGLGLTEKEFSALGKTAKLKIVEQASLKLVTPEYIAALKKTAGATLGEFQDMLFNPSAGLFGWMRELKLSGSKEVTSTIKEFQKWLASVSTFMGSLSGGLDPMVVISTLFKKGTDVFKELTRIVGMGGDVWNNVAFMFTKKVTDSISWLSDVIGKQDWAGMGYKFGNNIAKILSDDKLGATIKGLLFESIKALVSIIGGALVGVAEQAAQKIKDIATFKSTRDSIRESGTSLGDSINNAKRGFVKSIGGNVTKQELNDSNMQLPQLTSSNSTGNYDNRSYSYTPNITISGTDLNKTQLLSMFNEAFEEYKGSILA